MLRIFIIVSLLVFIPATALCFRCNGRLVTQDMGKSEVIELCGPPIHAEDTGVIWSGNKMIVKGTWVMEVERGQFRRIIFWSGNKMIEVRLGSRRK